MTPGAFLFETHNSVIEFQAQFTNVASIFRSFSLLFSEKEREREREGEREKGREREREREGGRERERD